MTWQEPILPQEDGDLYMQYLLCSSNCAATADHYGCTESAVRTRIRRYEARHGIERGDGRKSPRNLWESTMIAAIALAILVVAYAPYVWA